MILLLKCHHKSGSLRQICHLKFCETRIWRSHQNYLLLLHSSQEALRKPWDCSAARGHMALPVAPSCILAVSPGSSCLSCGGGLALWFCWLPLPFSRLWLHWPHPHPGKSHCLPMFSWFEALVFLCQGSYSQASEFRRGSLKGLHFALKPSFRSKPG